MEFGLITTYLFYLNVRVIVCISKEKAAISRIYPQKGKCCLFSPLELFLLVD